MLMHVQRRTKMRLPQ